MNKKILSAFLALTLSGSMLFSTASAVTMYAPDGRTAKVAEADVSAWKAVGWYENNYITMYAPDGRTAKVALADIKAWENVGWFKNDSITMYAPDGRTAKVKLKDVDAWRKVGWYKNINDAKKTLYAPDGRTVTVYKSQVKDYVKVGWYESPYTSPVPAYTTPSSSTNYSNTVYIGETGTKYHKKSCSTLKGNGIPISLQEALAQGRAACKRCGG